jgi:hypothetical protein
MKKPTKPIETNLFSRLGVCRMKDLQGRKTMPIRLEYDLFPLCVQVEE